MEPNRRKHPQIILLGDKTRIDEAGLLEGFLLFATTQEVPSAQKTEHQTPSDFHDTALRTPQTYERSPRAYETVDSKHPMEESEPKSANSEQQTSHRRNKPSKSWCHSSVAKEIFRSIRRYTDVVAVHFSPTAIPDSVLRQPLDFAICFGGDGAILRAAKQLQPLQIPALAVNLGHLGFLADVAPEALSETLQILDTEGIDSRVQSHLMLHCCVRKSLAADDANSLSTSRLSDTGHIDEAVALNEISVQTGDSFRLIDLELAIDGETVSHYSGDGLILATPVGSTAHSLSAGGPILRHGLDAVLICPLNPHTLTMRPVVDSAERKYTITVVHGEPGMSLIVDGTVLTRLQTGDQIEITRASAIFRTITPPRHSYYRTLREKLGWSGQFDAKKKR